MKRLRTFAYFEPASLKEAIRILEEQGTNAYPLAGGTDLLVRMRRGDIQPSALINLKRIEGLNTIEKDAQKGIRIGALSTISEIEHSPLVRTTHSLLAKAAIQLGSPSIRNLATLGGNIGRASPASDIAPSLIVLEARACVEGSEGKRELGIEELFKGPGITSLSQGELITSFLLPPLTPRSFSVYLKLGRREGMECALVGVAALLTLSERNSQELRAARIALAAVSPIPLRARKAEEALLSGSLNEEKFKEAARAAADESFPITDMRASGFYRKEMVRVLCYRAILGAFLMAKEGEMTS